MVRVPSPSRALTVATLLSRASRSTSTQAGRSAASRSSTPGAASGAAVRRRLSSDGASEGSGAAVEAMPVQVAEGSRLADEHQLHRAGLAVAVLRDDQLGKPLVLVRGIVDFIAIDEGDHVCVLLDGARLTKVRELRPVVAAPPLGLAGELGKGDD